MSMDVPTLQQCLAVIPARGASKRIRRKNVREFCGRPIIARTIEAATGSELFDRVVVSTDCVEIAEVSRTYGAEVPFLRSAELSDDQTPVSLATLDALERLDPAGNRYTAVCQLMPNCPLRDAADVQGSFRQFVRTGAEVQLSITRFGWLNPWWAMTRDEQFGLTPLFEERMRRRSQDLPVVFCPSGAVWWAKASTLRSARTFYIPQRRGWELPWQRAVDIDTEEDWQFAEALSRQVTGR